MKFIFLFLLLIFTGCGVTTPHVIEYRINPLVDENKYEAIKCVGKSLKIMQTFSASSLMSTQMKYTQKDYEEFSFTTSAWAQNPNRALNSAILQSIRASNLFNTVSGYKSRSRNDFTLESTIEEFIQSFDTKTQKSFANIIIYMSLIDNKTSKVIASKRFVQKQNVLQMDAQGGVEALNKGLGVILYKTNKWLNGICQ